MDLSTLPKIQGLRRRKKRVGRGYGSGKGRHTTGRGQKGQKARRKIKLSFEGGQLPLVNRLPKRPHFRTFSKKSLAINLGRLNKLPDSSVVCAKSLFNLGLVKKSFRGPVKILGEGEIKRKITIEGLPVSASARKKIEAAGGQIS